VAAGGEEGKQDFLADDEKAKLRGFEKVLINCA